MADYQDESVFSFASGNDLPYVVIQVTLKEKFWGTGSDNLTDLEEVINAQVARGYRLHSFSTAHVDSKGLGGGDRIQATMVFERLGMFGVSAPQVAAGAQSGQAARVATGAQSGQAPQASGNVLGVTGKKLTHRTYGAGTITERDGDTLTVRFADRSMRLSYLYCSRKGLLRLSDQALEEAFEQELAERKSKEEKRYGISLIGEEVRHNSFGQGIIMGREGDVLTVCFGGGDTKELSCEFSFRNRILQLEDRALQEEMTKRQRKK